MSWDTVLAVYIDVKKNSASGDEYVLLKKYVAWHFDKHCRENPEQSCVVLMDMAGAGISNIVRAIWILLNFNQYLILFSMEKKQLRRCV